MAKRKQPQRKSGSRTKAKAKVSKQTQRSVKQTLSLQEDNKLLNRILLAAILVLTLVSFTPIFQNEFTNWDDNVYVTENTMITSLSGENIKRMFTEKVSSNHHPLTMMLYAINYQMSQTDPSSYAATQLLFHLLNVFLVFVVAKKLAGGKDEVGLFVALFFGIHPMHVESVAWLSEHKDVLYTFFLLLSLNSYIKYIDLGGISERNKQAWVNYGLCFLFLLLSLNSKSAAVAFPVALFVVDYWRKRSLEPMLFIEKLPLLGVALAYGLIALDTQSGAINESYSFFEKIGYASYGYSMYFLKLFVPTGLASFHPYPPTGESIPTFYSFMPLVALAIVGATVFSMRRTRLIAFGVGFFSIMISLTLQLIAVGGSVMAERYTYVPYFGLFFILGYGLHELSQHSKWKQFHRPVVAGVAVIGLLFTYMSYERTKVWKDSQTLWSDVLESYPKCGRAWLMKGVKYYDEGEDQTALDHFNKAVQYRNTMEQCYYNRGLVLNRLKRYDEAIQDFDRAIAGDGSYVQAYHHKGNAMYYKGNTNEELSLYNRALELDPNFAKSYTNRGLVYYQRKEYQNAVSDLVRSSQLEPNNTLTYNNLGAAYAALGKNQEAIQSYSRAITLNPNNPNAYGNRAILYRNMGQEGKAQQDEAKARKLRQR